MRFLLVFLLFTASFLACADTLNVPYNFSSGGVIRSAEVNSNFSTIEDIVNGKISYDNLKDNAVTSAKIANGAITAAKIAAGAIGTGSIAAGSIGTTEIQSNAVTYDKIAPNSIRSYHLYPQTIETSDLSTSCVTLNVLASNSVDGSKIVDGSVTNTKLGALAVTSDKIAVGGVAATNYAAGSVGTAALADSGVTTPKIADGSITAVKLEASVADFFTVKKAEQDIGYVNVNNFVYQSWPITSLPSGANILTMQVFVYDTTGETWAYSVPPQNTHSRWGTGSVTPSATQEVYLNGYVLLRDNSTGFWSICFAGQQSSSTGPVYNLSGDQFYTQTAIACVWAPGNSYPNGGFQAITSGYVRIRYTYYE